jgi:carotenoid cleavage dioxygenase-like enzyme
MSEEHEEECREDRESPSALGFASQPEELSEPVALAIEGELPAWLEGRLIRTGPGRFEVGPDAYRHWFDGLALLTSTVFAKGGATFASRYLRSKSYEKAMQRGGIALREFGTIPPGLGFFGRVRDFVLGPEATDNANVNVVDYDEGTSAPGALVAMTETSHRVTFDRRTLETRGPLAYDDRLPGQMTTAHPIVDRARGKVFEHLIQLGASSWVSITSMDLGTRTRRELVRLPTREPAYIHSMGASKDHVIYTEIPFRARPLRMRFGSGTFLDAYRWLPELGTRVRVIHKDTGAVAADSTVEPFFLFHHANAFEAEGAVVVDLVTHEDASVMDRLSLADLRSPRPPDTAARLRRLTIPLRGGDARLEDVTEVRLELPRIDPRREGAKHRYVFGTASVEPTTFFDTLYKVDCDSGDTRRYHEAGLFPGEPVFVPAPGDTPEDEGVVLSLAIDARAHTGRLLVLDAASLTLRASALLPELVPFHFHGQFFPEPTARR